MSERASSFLPAHQQMNDHCMSCMIYTIVATL